ncbi:unnamed protein product [marine sediment metagenome]|uniref:Uncharacterized protein n=1 Tax=marine sediment metagenome TaxID=412755 RepID=X0UU25_9ZZZZ
MKVVHYAFGNCINIFASNTMDWKRVTCKKCQLDKEQIINERIATLHHRFIRAEENVHNFQNQANSWSEIAKIVKKEIERLNITLSK